MNDETLLDYGIHELAAFRADMARRRRDCAIENHATSDGVSAILRNAEERRNAAGMTRTQAEQACLLAAMAERTERHKAQL